MNQEWNIKARNEACQQCARLFSGEEVFYSRLSFGEEGYSRHDYCSACWEATADKSALSIWKAVFKAPDAPPDEPLKKETAESLLRQLMETDDLAHRNVIYILAVMLERRRILVERDVQVRNDGVKVRLYEHKKSGETFLIPDPELRLRELGQVQEEVLVMLGGNPMPSQKPAEPVSPPAPTEGEPPAGAP